MSKKHDKKNYELKSDAVEKLLKAEAGEVPEFSQEELNKYRKKSRIKLSETAKVLLLKAWFAGAVCFFMIWGLSMYVQSILDLLVAVGIALGMVTDLLVNSILRFMEKYPGQNDKWMLFPKKTKLGSFFLNIVYGLVLVYCVYFVYTAINAVIAVETGNPEMVAMGVEPVGFGLLCMGFDLLFIGFKRMWKRILQDAKDQVQRESPN